LRPYGIDQMDMPFTGPKIWAALQKSKGYTSLK